MAEEKEGKKNIMLTPMQGQSDKRLIITDIPGEVSVKEALTKIGAVSVEGDEKKGYCASFPTDSRVGETLLGYSKAYAEGYDQIDWKN